MEYAIVECRNLEYKIYYRRFKRKAMKFYMNLSSERSGNTTFDILGGFQAENRKELDAIINRHIETHATELITEGYMPKNLPNGFIERHEIRFLEEGIISIGQLYTMRLLKTAN